MRFGPYTEGGARPMKLKLKTQSATEILLRTYILRDFEECKDVFIRNGMNEEGRQKGKELKKESNQKNIG